MAKMRCFSSKAAAKKAACARRAHKGKHAHVKKAKGKKGGWCMVPRKRKASKRRSKR